MAYDDRDDEIDDELDIRRHNHGGGVPTYLTQAILVTLCCCVPLGIVGIVNASQVNTYLARGEYDLAVAASDRAKQWCLIGIFLGIPSNILVIWLQTQAR